MFLIYKKKKKKKRVPSRVSPPTGPLHLSSLVSQIFTSFLFEIFFGIKLFSTFHCAAGVPYPNIQAVQSSRPVTKLIEFFLKFYTNFNFKNSFDRLDCLICFKSNFVNWLIKIY